MNLTIHFVLFRGVEPRLMPCEGLEFIKLLVFILKLFLAKILEPESYVIKLLFVLKIISKL